MPGMKWRTLEHNGILFSPPYESKGIKIAIRGKPVDLDMLQEEMVYQWAKKKDTPYALDPTFQSNFTADFARTLNSKFDGVKYGEIDFTDAYRLVDQEKDKRDMMTKEKRKELAAQRKEIREEMKAEYGTAVMDGQAVEVGNYMAEPPGIFIGRGAHPLRGRWKRRVTPADVTLNLGRKAPVPAGDWKEIVRRRYATWLASWRDDLTKKAKYVWLADTAKVKQDRDRGKYDKAIDLSKEIDKIKERMVHDMKGGDEKKARIATACYLIYRTAMRVGDEKDPNEADTVGATTLRKEHIRISQNAIKFDFLGKDSVRWQETVSVVIHDMQFRDNLALLVADKKPKDEIFHDITSRNVNKYFSGIVKGLTAKVFRTYLASTVVNEYLKKHTKARSSPDYEKLHHIKMANLEAAMKCNHKRTIPKTFEQSLQKKRDKLAELKGKRPWAEDQKTLRDVKAYEPKTDKQKAAKRKRIKRLRATVQGKKEAQQGKIKKAGLQIELAEKTRDYNLGTSLRNYIDPRILKFWADKVDAPREETGTPLRKKSLREKTYTAALQKKFLWVNDERGSWESISRKY